VRTESVKALNVEELKCITFNGEASFALSVNGYCEGQGKGERFRSHIDDHDAGDSFR